MQIKLSTSCVHLRQLVLCLGFCGMGQVGMAASVTSLHRELEVGHALHLVKVFLGRSQQPAPPVA